MFQFNFFQQICVWMGILLVCLTLNVPISQAKQEIHPNGWSYPSGSSYYEKKKGFHGYPGHLGQDYMLPVGAGVYSIADNGVIVNYELIRYYGSNCGDKGGVFLVKYPQDNGQYFYALYGHAYLASHLSVGSVVHAGQMIGIIHEYSGDFEENKCRYDDWEHLHFGIHPQTKPDPWYKGVNKKSDMGWVDPVLFMNDYSTKSNNKTVFQFNGNDTEGWVYGNAIYQSRVENGQYKFNVYNDPYIFGPAYSNGIDTDQFRTLEISMTAEFEYGKQSQNPYIYHVSEDEDFNENNKVSVSSPQSVKFDGFHHLYTWHFKEGLSLYQLRFDPVEKSDFSSIGIDFIRLVSHWSKWNFDHSLYGWNVRNSVTGFVPDGIKLYAISGDPGAISPWLGLIHTGKYKSLLLSYAVLGDNKPLKGKVYFDLTDDQKGFSEHLSYAFDIDSSGEISNYQIPLPDIKRCQKIFRIRVDFYEGTPEERLQIIFSKAEFSEQVASDQGYEILFNGQRKLIRKSRSTQSASHITIHKIAPMIMNTHAPINFKAYAFGCCSDQYLWEFIENPLNLSISDDGTITGDTGNETGEYQTIIRAQELFEGQQDHAEETFTITVSDHPDQKAIRIFNDGSGVLEINKIVTQNLSSWIDFSTSNLPISIDGGHFYDLPVSVNRDHLAIGNYTDTLEIYSNDPTDQKISIPVSLNVTSDISAPPPPENLTVLPDSWAGKKGIQVDWTNPFDPSGINGIYYKIGAPPESNEDGHYSEDKPFKFFPKQDGKQRLYVWLKDNSDNLDFKHLADIDFFYDSQAPFIQSRYPDADAIDVDINTSIKVTISDDHSGINQDTIELQVNDESVSFDMSPLSDSLAICYTPDSPFDEDQTIRISLSVSDLANPQNSMSETSWSFTTLSKPTKGQIAGDITYKGDASGQLIIDAYSFKETTIPISSATYEWTSGDTTKSYTLNDLPFDTYLITAFIDMYNDEYNGIPDTSEPQGKVNTTLSTLIDSCDLYLEQVFPSCPQWDFNIDEDQLINYLDLNLFGDHWLLNEDSENWNPKFNLSTDPDETSGKQTINFMDLMIFVDHWLESSPCK
ncbi:hypothetical protein MHK_002018 [Candidatus Magnetomorum sp. HK-1]|nr:hypothetical protein MHK_002018 [Candidatus Magnetomorum sp. HK-1]